MMEFKLSVEQQLAAYTDSNKVLVCASAGAGKTATLIERVRYLLYEKQINPEEVFCITYTNMAAEEMKLRLGDKGNDCFVGTIHSLANKILLNSGINTFKAIEEEDFDRFFSMLNNNLDKLKLPKVTHLLVDEIQDVCDNEYEFMTGILDPENFWVVGDSRQAIYGFKGGNYHIFMELTEDPFCDVFELNDCYRCGPEIIDFANYQIKKVRDIYRTRTHCIKPYGEAAVDEDEFSYEAILSSIEDIKDYKNTAVLCRSNKMVDDIMFFLKKHNIPCVTFKKAEKTFLELQEEMKQDSVKVLTIHSAKGLEWDNVIVFQEFQNWKDEEQRISYVAATRARNYLLWLKPKPKAKKRKTFTQQYMESQMVGW